MNTGMEHFSLSEAESGDVLWREGHCGIYIGTNGDGVAVYVNAENEDNGVRYETGFGTFTDILRPFS
jgi:hypothetical protein